MVWVKMGLQLFIAFSIVNVWVFRFSKPTRWRGGNALNMRDEFALYGLPLWFMSLIGFLKLSFSALLVASIWFPALAVPAATGIALLMGGAVAMHIKVKDSLAKSFPAFSFLVLALITVSISMPG